MDALIVIAVVLAVVVLVSAPLRGKGEDDGDAGVAGDLAELEAAKEAKYREIRDAELDYRTGKLSQEDWQALDGGLRAEAVELLKRLDAVRGRAGSGAGAVG
jgi:hypothetical protein